MGFPVIFLQRLGLETSDLARSWRLPRPITKSHAEERVGMALGPREAAQNLVVPLQYLQKLATSNLVYRLGLPRSIIKSHPEEKVGIALG